MKRGIGIGAWMLGAVVGALVMDAVAVLWAGPAGAWPALKCPAFPFAMHPGFNLPVLLASQLGHGIVAIAWGILFGLLFAKKSAATLLLAGPLWGIVVLVAMYFVVLPAFDMEGYVKQTNLLHALALHVGYGVGLGAVMASYAEHRRATDLRVRFRTARRDQPAEA